MPHIKAPREEMRNLLLIDSIHISINYSNHTELAELRHMQRKAVEDSGIYL